MKKYLFILLATMTFTACNDDDNGEYTEALEGYWCDADSNILWIMSNGYFEDKTCMWIEGYRGAGFWVIKGDILKLTYWNTRESHNYYFRIGLTKDSELSSDTLFLWGHKEGKNKHMGDTLIYFKKDFPMISNNL